jgi:predicted dinucleotide-binding enzyme
LKDYNISVFVAADDPTAKQIVMQLAQELGFSPIDSGTLRNARLIEGLADLERFLLIHQNMGAYAVPSFTVLPSAPTQRLGGRQPSTLN